jgi:multicomponent Na+:H+ antiporter subunit B
MALTVTAIIRIRNLYAVVMLGSIFSLLAASIFVVLDAVDVAFTEAAVGAGISTVLTLGTIALTTSREKPSPHTRLLPIAVVLITGAALIYGTLDLAEYGDPNAPVHKHVAPTYLTEGPIKTGVPNIVTVILASYRGYDTLGEVVVVFTAGVGVILLMGNWRRRGRRRRVECIAISSSASSRSC